MQPGDTVADRFRIEEPAGAGGMGFVFRATDMLAGGNVALKVLAAVGGDARRFAREARVLAELRHPGIVRYVAHGETSTGAPYIAMQWLEGEDLGKRLSHRGLTLAESILVARRVAEALGAAHARGIVHRDVKPSNLFVPGGDLDRITVLDFGIARVGARTRMATGTGTLVGTPGYMAPEQARGDVEIDARADVFALGCVLFECVTGRPAFLAEAALGLLAKIIFEEAPRLAELRPSVPADLDALVGRMLAKSPADRPANGAELVEELQRLGKPEDDGEPPPPSLRQPSLTVTERRTVSIVVAVGETLATDTLDPTLTWGHAQVDLEPMRAAIAPFGARLELLVDGSAIATVTARGAASDLAASAARCALAMRRHRPRARMVLATGHGELRRHVPVGDVIERAAKLVRAREEAEAEPVSRRGVLPIHIDEVTAGLLDARFEVESRAEGFVLSGEREVFENARTLLGKPSACVGRDRELTLLRSTFDECVDEPVARAIVLRAPAGFGKSRLRFEFVRTLKEAGQHCEVWVGRGDPTRAGAPFTMIAPAILRSAGVLESEPLAAQQQKLRARVARHLSGPAVGRVTPFLGEMVGVRFDDADNVALRAARRDAVLLVEEMRRAWVDLLAAECAAGAVLLVLEDLHWGDAPSVDFVGSALRELRDAPFMVLALARPDIDDVFPRLWSERDVLEIRLSSLTRKASAELVTTALGGGIDPHTVADLVERAAGNAFYLEELVRAVAAGKGGALPETVLAMVETRLATLEPEARRVLRAASVFGDVFWRAGVLTLLGGESKAGGLDAWLDALVEYEFISRRAEERFAGERAFAFRHGLLREGAYAMLTEADRKLGHRLAAGWLERSGERNAALIADHLERGDERGRAVEWYRRATEQALEAGDFGGAVARAERGVACGAVGPSLGLLRWLEGQAERWRGRWAEAEPRLSEAVGLLKPGTAAWCEAVGEASIARTARDLAIDDLADALLATPIDPGASRELATALSRACACFAGTRLFARMEELLVPLEALCSKLPARDPLVSGQVARARYVKALCRGDLASYVRSATAALADFREAGDLRMACETASNLGDGLRAMGLYDRAEPVLYDAVQTAERLGIVHIAASAKQNLGFVVAQRGAFELARKIETEAADVFHGNRRSEGTARLYLAYIELAANDLAAALVQARSAVDLLEATPSLRPFASALLARVELRQGRTASALEVARGAAADLEALGQVEEGEAFVRLVFAEALHESGEHGEAAGAIRRARERLLEQAARLDGELRDSFLANVPENARTLELAHAWTGEGDAR